MFFFFFFFCVFFFCFFFFQAEDGIRDVAVTGVQTCALPISSTAAFRTSVYVGVEDSGCFGDWGCAAVAIL